MKMPFKPTSKKENFGNFEGDPAQLVRDDVAAEVDEEDDYDEFIGFSFTKDGAFGPMTSLL